VTGATRSHQHRAALGALILALCLLILASVEGRAHAGPESGDCAPDQVIVELKPGKKITPINVLYGSPTTKPKKFDGSGNIYLLEQRAGSPGAEATAEKIRTEEKAKGVLHAEPNHLIQTPEGLGRFRARGESGVDPLFREYAASALNLSTAHAISRGEGTTVAVLDTGVQPDHPALIDALTDTGRDFIDDDLEPADEANGRDDDGDGEVDEMVGHGTHVAGIVHQVAPAAKIMPLRVLDTEGCGDVFHIAELSKTSLHTVPWSPPPRATRPATSRNSLLQTAEATPPQTGLWP
jgi:subtilisin family serine protease